MFSTSKSYGDTDFITGMRALAALAVVFIHAGGAGLREFGESANNLTDLGRAGVYVFFVISGFSVAQSLISSRGYFDYLNKRIWRIAPLYYFWLIVTILLSVTAMYWQDRFGVKVDAYNIIMHFGFLSFLDYKITNSIMGVEWSISIEVFWYLLVPVLLLLSKRRIVLLAMVAISAIIHKQIEKHAGLLPIAPEDANVAAYWSPLPYLFSFCLGIAAFRTREALSASGRFGDFVLLASGLLIVAYCVFPTEIRMVFRDDFFLMSWITFAMIVAGSSNSSLFNGLLANRFVVFVGTISYGVYLCHMPLINLLAKFSPDLAANKLLYFIVVSALSCLISFVTFHTIEKPGGALGKRFGKHPFFSKTKESAASA